MSEQRPPIEALAPTWPFSDTPEAYFGEGDRGRQLDELRHVSRWSRRLLAVTGERGVGKSTMYRALSGRLDPVAKAARINANLTSDAREVLAGIIQGFGMAAPANADPELLVELIVLHVHEQIDANRYCLVMIDDAHLLELRALEQLLNLVESNTDEGLRIVFFADPYFVQSLEKAARRTNLVHNWHEIRLTPFNEDESRRYVEFRLAHAGLQLRSTFTQNQLSVIVGGSNGLPGRINELATAILTGDLTINDERGWLPRMHRAVVVLVVIAAGMGWLIFNRYAPDSAAPIARPDASDQAEEPAPDVATAKLPIALPSAEKSGPHEQPPKPDQSTAEAAPGEPPAAGEEDPTATVTPTGLPGRADEPPPPAPEPVPIATVGKPAEPPKVVGKTQTEQWLRRQPGNHFTLQLFATSSRQMRDRFVSRQPNPERFATFETQRNRTTWYAVTYGDFATRAEATAAAAALPPIVGRVEPWIRTFASVQASLD